jgi:hypothetical protein
VWSMIREGLMVASVIAVLLHLVGCSVPVGDTPTVGNACVWPGDVGGALVQTSVFDGCETPPCMCEVGASCFVGDLRDTDGGTTATYGTCTVCAAGARCEVPSQPEGIESLTGDGR